MSRPDVNVSRSFNLNFSLLRQVSLLGIGAGGAKAVAFLFIPLITRLYGPEVYGLLGIYTALTLLLLPLANLTFPTAVVLADSTTDALGLAKLSLTAAVLFCCLAELGLLMWGHELLALLGLQAIQAYVWLLPITVFVLVAQQLAEQWLLRRQRFGLIAGIGVGQAVVAGTGKSVMGLVYPFAWVLILLNTIFSAVYVVWVGWCSLRPGDWKSRPRHGISSLFALARRYRDFPIFRMPDAIVYALGQSAPVLSLAAFSGEKAAGLFVLARTVLALPAMLLGKASGDVFYPQASQTMNAGLPLFSLLHRHVLFLFIAGIMPFAVVMVWGNVLFGWVFGDAWRETGQYAQWLSVLVFTSMLNVPVVRLATVLRLQAGLLFFTCTSTLLMLAAMYWSFEMGDELLAIQAFCLTGAAMNLVFMTVIMWRCWQRDAGCPEDWCGVS